MDAQVAEEPASGERGHEEKSEKEPGLGEPVVPRQFDHEDEETQGDHRSAMTRWKRPASECGQGSSGRTISRPWSESVQRPLLGQALQTCARAR